MGEGGIKRRTDEYDYPSEKRGFFILRISQPSTFESFCCLDHKEARLILSTKGVVVETLVKSQEQVKSLSNERRRNLTNT